MNTDKFEGNENKGVLDLRNHKFAQVPNVVLADTKILDKAAQKLVYTMLCMHADNHKKTSYPSVATLAEECMIGKTSVREAVRKLKEVGLIDVRERKTKATGHMSNLYVLLPIPKDFEELGTDNEVPTPYGDVP